MDKTSFAGTRSFIRRSLFTIAAAISLLVAAPVEANLIITVGSASAASPSSGNTLEVDLLNTGPLAISLAGFAFEISVSDPHITFTSATINTVATYIFAGNSLFGPVISTSPTGQTLDASDIWSSAGGAIVAAGATVGLGRVFFDVSPGDVSGPVTVALAPFPATSLSDDAGNNVVIETLVNGSITITGLVVSEPSGLALVLLGFMILAAGTSSRHAREAK